ncbi:MAG: glycosyltransferase, partial [Candidatus Omnitrophica bacterium]|nr:glycosyltransferase [Candidatus Omnitrophota bacterium]
MSSNAGVSAIVVSFGKSPYLWQLLDSLNAQTLHPCEIIVIDNSLDAALQKEIKIRYPHALLSVSPENLFYAEALNKGIEK